MPGDPAAAVDVDDGGAVDRPLGGVGALARGVDGRVLQQQHGVRRLARDHPRVQLALQWPRPARTRPGPARTRGARTLRSLRHAAERTPRPSSSSGCGAVDRAGLGIAARARRRRRGPPQPRPSAPTPPAAAAGSLPPSWRRLAGDRRHRRPVRRASCREVQRNDNSSFLPENAESTEVSTSWPRFSDEQTFPAFVLLERDGGADRRRPARQFTAFAQGIPDVEVPVEGGVADAGRLPRSPARSSSSPRGRQGGPGARRASTPTRSSDARPTARARSRVGRGARAPPTRRSTPAGSRSTSPARRARSPTSSRPSPASTARCSSWRWSPSS